MKFNMDTVRELFDLFILAIKCLAAQWLGIGKTEDLCGECWKCFAIRTAFLSLVFLIAWNVSPLIVILVGVAWIVYSGLTGKGWAGEALKALFDKAKQ